MEWEGAAGRREGRLQGAHPLSPGWNDLSHRLPVAPYRSGMRLAQARNVPCRANIVNKCRGRGSGGARGGARPERLQVGVGQALGGSCLIRTSGVFGESVPGPSKLRFPDRALPQPPEAPRPAQSEAGKPAGCGVRCQGSVCVCVFSARGLVTVACPGRWGTYQPHSEAEDGGEEARPLGPWLPSFGRRCGPFAPCPARHTQAETCLSAGVFPGWAALPRAPGTPWPREALPGDPSSKWGQGWAQRLERPPRRRGPAPVQRVFSSCSEPRRGGRGQVNGQAVREQGSFCPPHAGSSALPRAQTLPGPWKPPPRGGGAPVPSASRRWEEAVPLQPWAPGRVPLREAGRLSLGSPREDPAGEPGGRACGGSSAQGRRSFARMPLRVRCAGTAGWPGAVFGG